MTLKRYQPARKRKRPSKKNRPLKLAVALGVVGVAAGASYLGLHGEIIGAMLDGSVDLPGLPAKAPQGAIAAMPDPARPAAVAKATPTPRLTLAASPAALKLTAVASPSPAAAPPAFALEKASPKPSAFPEAGKPQQAAAPADDLFASAVPLKPAGVIPAEELPRPAKPAAAKPIAAAPSPAAKPSPAPVRVVAAAPAASPKAVVTARPAPVARASAAPKPKPSPAARPQAAAARPAAIGPRASLYFDKNSSYLSGAERGRLERLAGTLKAGTIHVSGYTDEQGDAKYNRWIAERRAQRVADIIRAQTGGKVRVVVDGIGTLPGDGEQSRRVEVEVR